MEREEGLHHNFLVTTHSSLLLTDAPCNHIFLFGRKDGKTQVRQVPISLFAASRNEVSQNMFQISAEIGRFADRESEKVLRKEENLEKLREYIEQMGPELKKSTCGKLIN